MTRRKHHVDAIVADYKMYAQQISQCNESLLNSNRGFFGRKLKSNLTNARAEHKKFCENIGLLDDGFIGDLELYSHGNLAHLGIKDTNYKVVERARSVCMDNLVRYEKTLTSIEDSLNFKLSMRVAWLSIGVAVMSIVLNFIGQ